jgi:hypothetical protein
MKLIIGLLLLSNASWATKIPVTIFDQSKLETVLRNIPSSLKRIEKFDGYIRKHLKFPEAQSNFSITCQADYFNEAQIPSYKACELDVTSLDHAGEEYSLKIENPEIVKALRESFSYGQEIKKFYSTERIYGQAFDGKYRDLFRYMFICSAKACDATFATKI